jgi:hypothetical protein
VGAAIPVVDHMSKHTSCQWSVESTMLHTGGLYSSRMHVTRLCSSKSCNLIAILHEAAF